jgi:hypothetical protein
LCQLFFYDQADWRRHQARDIITQQHGGTIEVASCVGEFTEFTVRPARSSIAAPSEKSAVSS